MEIVQNIWGFTEQGEAVILYRMTNSNGASVSLTNIGAAIVSVTLPDADGTPIDVALGYADWNSYFYDGPAMGKTVGRFANRIDRGRFTLDGKEYRLTQNDPPNHLHGGVDGFANRLWASRVETNRVVFSLLSPDGDQGYPGELGVEVVYDWSDDNDLEITYFARSNAPTIVNMTNHAYFNMAGENSGSVLDNTLQLFASHYLAATPVKIPTGEIAAVEGTPMDFLQPKALGADIDSEFSATKIGYGYDSCWVVDGWTAEGELDERLREVAVLSDPVSGRSLRVSSTQSCVQVYTGNWLQGSPVSKSGREYENRDGIAIECQGYTDSPNHPEFPSQRLETDEVYNEKIVFSFRKARA